MNDDKTENGFTPEEEDEILKETEEALMSSEDKLKAIIEKQVESGHIRWKSLLKGELANGYLMIEEHEEYKMHNVLVILLDTQGCKACCPGFWCEDCNSQCPDNQCPFQEDYWAYSSDQILMAWNSGEGNNWQEAINTAYKLLP